MAGPARTVSVRRAGAADVDRAAVLFALYRQFYGQPYDEQVAAAFLRDRIGREESVVLLAEPPVGPPVGFAQLFPGFSSIAARPAWLLGDLYVREADRGRGAAGALLARAEELARDAGAAYVALETARDNLTAQRLYERHGYRVEDRFLAYEKQLG